MGADTATDAGAAAQTSNAETGGDSGGDLSIDAIVNAAMSAAAEAGEHVTKEDADKAAEAAGETKTDDKPAEGAQAKTETPAEKPAEGGEKPVSASEARRILREAERLKSEATGHSKREFDRFVAELRKNPKAALARLGGPSIDELIDASIAEGEVKAPTADDKIAEIDRKLAEIETREKRARVDARIREIHGNITAEKFPTIVAKDAKNLVTDFMTEYFQRHGKAIEWSQAARLVEKDLRGFSGDPKPAPKTDSKPAAAREVHSTIENGSQRATIPQSEEEKLAGMSPDKLLEYLVSHSDL